MARLKPGKTLEQVKAAMNSNDEKAMGLVAEEMSLPGVLLTPGNSVDITVPMLTAGTYALMCFLPAEPNGPPHFMKGMVGQLTVEAPKAKAPKNDATYTVTPGKGLTGPTTLKAGRHNFAVNVGVGGAELEPLFLFAPNGAGISAIKKQADEIFGGADKGVFPKGSGEKLAKLIMFAGRDFKKDRTVSFGVDLKPGQYIFAAVDTDIDKLPNPFLEQITIKVT